MTLKQYQMAYISWFKWLDYCLVQDVIDQAEVALTIRAIFIMDDYQQEFLAHF